METAIRWGILSTAQIGRKLIRAMRESDRCVVQAVASRTYTNAVEFAKEHAVPRAFGSYDEMLCSGEIDAVYNPLPNSLHAEWTIKALEAGLPVLCEKPLCKDAAEAAHVAEVARAKGVPVAEAFMYRHHPMYDALLEALAQDAIGEVVSIHASFGFNLADTTNIRRSAKLAGGALMDVGCYGVSFSRLVTGLEPVRATAIERRETVDETLHGVLEFPSSVLAHIECSFECDMGRSATITGTNGRIHIPEAWLPGEREAVFTIECNGQEERRTTPGANAYRLMVDDFCRVVRRGGRPRWPIQDAVRNMKAIDALYAAASSGKTVVLAG